MPGRVLLLLEEPQEFRRNDEREQNRFATNSIVASVDHRKNGPSYL